MTESHVVVTGMGIVSSIGWSLEEVQQSILNRTQGFRSLTCLNSPAFTGTLTGQVDQDPATKSGLEKGSRSDHLALYAARQAYQDARLEKLNDEDRSEIGIILGITTGGITTTEQYLEDLLKTGQSDIGLMQFHECSTPATTIANQLQLPGMQSTVSNACASGSNALALARECIQSGETDIMLAGGVDSLSRLTVNGFHSLLVHDDLGCRPFDKDRAGMTLGEGAAILVLESEEHARERDARIYARFTGAASTCDGYHATAPSPDGAAILKAMRNALEDAGRQAQDVDYINAHGTGTRENDSSESAALRSLFSDHMPPVSSTKGFTGHTLAAAGAVESVISILSLQNDLAPANIGLQQVDPELCIQPIAENLETRIDLVMNNSIGFGGNNCSLIFEKAK